MILIRKIAFIFIFLNVLACSKPTEIVKEYDDNGNLVLEYQRRKDDFAKQGWYKRYYPSGELNEEAQYVDNKLDGLRTIFFKNGKTQVIENHTDGKFEGLYQSFHNNGNLYQEGVYTDNVMNGEWKLYYNTGDLRETVYFIDNQENGPFKEYYQNGNLRFEGDFEGGDYEVGELKKYDESGALIAKLKCEIRQAAGEKFSQCTTTWRADAK